MQYCLFYSTRTCSKVAVAFEHYWYSPPPPQSPAAAPQNFPSSVLSAVLGDLPSRLSLMSTSLKIAPPSTMSLQKKILQKVSWKRSTNSSSTSKRDAFSILVVRQMMFQWTLQSCQYVAGSSVHRRSLASRGRPAPESRSHSHSVVFFLGAIPRRHRLRPSSHLHSVAVVPTAVGAIR